MTTTLLLLLTVTLAQADEVAEIRIVGSRTVPEQTILYYLEPLQQKPLTDGTMGMAFRQLWDTGLFEDIQFRREEAPTGGARLIVELEEKPWLAEVRIEGKGPYRNEQEVREKLTEFGVDLRLRQPFGEDDARRIAAVLRQAVGPSFAVSADIADIETGRVGLTLVIAKEMGDRLGEIAFEGNETFQESELLEAMQLKPSSWTTWLTRRNRFDRERLEADLERIRDLYLERGHLAVVVGPARVEGEGGPIRLTIPVQEGPVYLTNLILVEPGFLVKEETVRSWLSLVKGEPYDALAVRRTKELLEKRYSDRGYGAAQINVDERSHPVSRRADVAVRVRPGRLHLFGRIEIAGNEWTRDRHLRQYFTAMEMERFSLAAMDEDVRTLTTLGLVKAATPETRVGLDTNIIDVTYHVKEPPRFEYFVGGGANGVQGVSGNLGLVARGLIGQGETWSFDGELGNRLGNVSVGYLDPHSLGRRFSWSGSFIRQNIEYPDETSDDQTSFSLRLSGLGASPWRLLSGFQWAGFTLSSSLETPVPFLTPFLGQRFRTKRVNFDFGYEGRNQAIFPTRGTQWFAGTEVVGGPLGGDVDLIRLRGRAHTIIPLDGSRRRNLISLRGRAESVWSFGVTEDNGLPRFERLFLGSEGDMRAFPIREVGPKTPEGVPIGGDQLVYASAEYEFVASPRIRLVGFFDLGNVYATDLPDGDLPTLRYDAGAELRILAPFLNLPLRFGYGFNLERINDEPPGRFFFTISARF